MRVVEVCGHGDDCLSHGVTQVRLGITLELHQGTSTDFLGRVLLAVNVFTAPGGAHVALDRAESAIGVGDGLTLRHLADENFACFREGHD